MTDKLDIKITKLNLIANWDIADCSSNECQLCRRPFLAPALQELQKLQNNTSTILGNIVEGECKHMFHEKCMNDLINSGCQLCPIDKTTWKLKKTVKSGAVYSDSQKIAFKSTTK
jgi:hypothetical protein